MKFAGLLILAVFYTVYISKMIVQKRKGIQTDQMAKGKQKTIKRKSLLTGFTALAEIPPFWPLIVFMQVCCS